MAAETSPRVARPAIVRCLLILAVLFLGVRWGTVQLYHGTSYYYEMVANQFAIAEAARAGHAFSKDQVRLDAAMAAAQAQKRFVPIEAWPALPGSGRYETFPAQDLPGFGYLIAWTSDWFGGELTSRYAFGLQVLVEGSALLAFAACAMVAFGPGVGLGAGLLYVFAYPFVWPLASQPLRDIFVHGVYGCFLAGVFLFREARTRRTDALAVGCIVLGAGLLWVRPSAFPFLLMAAPLVLLLKTRTRRARGAFLLALIAIPMLVFAQPFKSFNLRHYGTTETHFIGRGLWEGMGIIPDNPYGFVLDDRALIPWTRRMGHQVKYSSPEMNRLLGEYASKVVREDPGFYVRTVLVRLKTILLHPLEVYPPARLNLVLLGETPMALGEYVRKHPAGFVWLVLNKVLTLFVFYGGMLAGAWMFWRCRTRRVEVALLLSPALYTLATQVPLHFEPRYLATGAWVLLLPIAWCVHERRRLFQVLERPAPAEQPGEGEPACAAS